MSNKSLIELPELQNFMAEFPLDNDVRKVCGAFDEYAAKSKSILVVGCLEEPVANSLGKLGYNVTGIDLRQYNKGDQYKGPDTPSYTHLVGDVREYYRNSSFDCIISISVIEHIGLGYYGESIDALGDSEAMHRINKNLKSGGICIITVPYGKSTLITKHWRRYTKDTISRLTQDFIILKKHFFQTSYLGNKDLTEDEANRYDDLADVSILLVMKKP